MHTSRDTPQSFWPRRADAGTIGAHMSDYQQLVGGRLRALREQRSLSQEDAAHLVGVSTKTWQNWERGERAPYQSNWRKIQAAFKLESLDYIRGTAPAPDDRLAGIEQTQREILARVNFLIRVLGAMDPSGLAAEEITKQILADHERHADDPEGPDTERRSGDRRANDRRSHLRGRRRSA